MLMSKDGQFGIIDNHDGTGKLLVATVGQEFTFHHSTCTGEQWSETKRVEELTDRETQLLIGQVLMDNRDA